MDSCGHGSAISEYVEIIQAHFFTVSQAFLHFDRGNSRVRQNQYFQHNFFPLHCDFLITSFFHSLPFLIIPTAAPRTTNMASPGDKLLRAQADKAFDILAAYSGGIEILVKRFDKKDPDYLRVKAILDNANQEMVDLGLADELEKLQKDGKLYTVLSLSDINSKAFKPSSTTTAKSYRTEIKKNTTSQRRGVRTPTKNASDDESSEDGDFGVDADLETEIDREEKELKGDDEAFEGASDGESTNMAFRGTHDTSNAFVYRNKELAQTVGGIATTNLPSAAILKEFNEFLAVKRAQEAELSSNKQRTAPAGGK